MIFSPFAFFCRVLSIVCTTTEPILSKQIHRTKIKQNNSVTNQDYTKENTQEENKWITFIFFGYETQQFAKIFEDTPE
jgi:hypothetical protein